MTSAHQGLPRRKSGQRAPSKVPAPLPACQQRSYGWDCSETDPSDYHKIKFSALVIMGLRFVTLHKHHFLSPLYQTSSTPAGEIKPFSKNLYDANLNRMPSAANRSSPTHPGPLPALLCNRAAINHGQQTQGKDPARREKALVTLAPATLPSADDQMV